MTDPPRRIYQPRGPDDPDGPLDPIEQLIVKILAPKFTALIKASITAEVQLAAHLATLTDAELHQWGQTARPFDPTVNAAAVYQAELARRQAERPARGGKRKGRG
jgi:hypothetical protein